jgi:hypothetical protein
MMGVGGDLHFTNLCGQLQRRQGAVSGCEHTERGGDVTAQRPAFIANGVEWRHEVARCCLPLHALKQVVPQAPAAFEIQNSRFVLVPAAVDFLNFTLPTAC